MFEFIIEREALGVVAASVFFKLKSNEMLE